MNKLILGTILTIFIVSNVKLNATTNPNSGNNIPKVVSGSTPTYTLLFQDDFNTVNASNWNLYTTPGNLNFGLKKPAQISSNNGILVITAEMINGVLNSGGLSTKLNITYGRFEGRVLCESDPTGVMSGLLLTWPQSQNSPLDGENDFYETSRAIRTTTSGWKSFIHYLQNGQNKASSFIHRGNSMIWHTVAMDWTPTEIRMYDDGVLVWTDSDITHIPKVPHKLCIQYDAFDSYISASSRLMVDWVKIYAIDGLTTSINTLKSDCEALITNPVDRICKIFNGNFKYAQVFTIGGQLVLNSKIDYNNEIDFSTLKAGCYLIKLYGLNQKTFKVIKE